MTLARGIKRRLRTVLPAVVFLSLAGYFGWNATRGDLGLHAYVHRNQDLAAANTALDEARAEQDQWQRKVASLEPAHLDRDALDERARQMLNLSSPDDIVVPAKN